MCSICCSLFQFYLSLVEYVFFFFKQKTAYEMRISDWSSDVCSSDLLFLAHQQIVEPRARKPAEDIHPRVQRRIARVVEPRHRPVAIEARRRNLIGDRKSVV